MSIRKILLTTGTVLILATGGFLAARGGLTAPASAAASPSTALQPATAAGPLTETPYRYGSVGQVTIFRRGAEPGRFVILISDKAGWTPALTLSLIHI